jgi:hypothetical protein
MKPHFCCLGLRIKDSEMKFEADEGEEEPIRNPKCLDLKIIY